MEKNLYKIENKKIKYIKKNLKLENNLSKQKKYYDYDDIEYKGIRGVRNLFNLTIDEDYYRPIRSNSAFNGNYFEYESMR